MKKEWPWGPQTPDNNLMRFVARRFGWPDMGANQIRMLDIGSGEGANARWLDKRGHIVWTLDKDPATDAEFCEDVSDFDGVAAPYDCIYDVNTLCHVVDPPFEKIKSWLESDGYFFSICPSKWAPSRVAEGKDFTRFARLDEIRHALRCFSEVDFREYSAPDFLGNQLRSWIVEARP